MKFDAFSRIKLDPPNIAHSLSQEAALISISIDCLGYMNYGSGVFPQHSIHTYVGLVLPSTDKLLTYVTENFIVRINHNKLWLSRTRWTES